MAGQVVGFRLPRACLPGGVTAEQERFAKRGALTDLLFRVAPIPRVRHGDLDSALLNDVYGVALVTLRVDWSARRECLGEQLLTEQELILL